MIERVKVPAPLMMAVAVFWMFALCAQAAASREAIAWQRDAMSSTAVAARSAVHVTSNTLVDGRFRADILIRAGGGANADEPLVLALPAGQVLGTTFTLHSPAEPRPINLTELGWVRGTRLVAVSLPSLAPNGRSVETSGILEIDLDLPPTTPTVQPEPGPLHDALRLLVANPADLDHFRSATPPIPSDINIPPDWPGSTTHTALLRIPISDNGLYRFTPDQLRRLGVPQADLDSKRVSLWANHAPVPLFDFGNTLLFWGAPSTDRYTTETIYWLRSGPAEKPLTRELSSPAPITGSPLPAFTETLTIDQDEEPVLTRNDQFLTIIDFTWARWTWTNVPTARVPDPRPLDQPGQLAFNLPGYAAANYDRTLSATVHLYTHAWPREAPMPQLAVQVNGQHVQTATVPPGDTPVVQLQIPGNLLQESSCTLTLQPVFPDNTTPLSGTMELCFDRFEIDYSRDLRLQDDRLLFTAPHTIAGNHAHIVDAVAGREYLILDLQTSTPRILGQLIADPDGTIEVTGIQPGGRYLVQSTATAAEAPARSVAPQPDLRSDSNRADLLVITHPLFAPQMMGWADARRAEGHAVALVNVFDIYDQFAAGKATPEAIRRFLAFAMRNWQGSPLGAPASAVLLVGDSTSAYRNEFRNNVVNYVPSMTVQEGTDRFASDQYYATLSGNDLLADALIGRFSVNNTADLDVILEKQKRYRQTPAPGPWRNTLGFVADHSGFEEPVQRLMRRQVPPSLFLSQVLLNDEPWIDNYFFPAEIQEAKKAKVSPSATGKIREMFNKGAAVITYFGHGSPNIWSNERIWFGGDSENSDNLTLTNINRLPLIINMTCNSGAIDYPQPKWNICISEDFMRVPNGGSVACYVPSGPGITSQHERLMAEICRSMFVEDLQPAAAALTLANWRYLAKGNPGELTRMYIYLGDPVLNLQLSREATAAELPATVPAPWPGTVGLPPEAVAESTGGHYQLRRFNTDEAQGSIDTFTTAARALPLAMPAAGTETMGLAADFTPPGSTRAVRTFIPGSVAGNLVVGQWTRIDQPLTPPGTTATVELQVTCGAAVPVHSAAIIARSANGVTESNVGSFLPGESRRIRLELPLGTGLNTFALQVRSGENTVDVQLEKPLVLARLRTDDQATSVPPAIIDPATISVQYHQAAEGLGVSVNCCIHNLSRESITGLRVGLQPEGAAVRSDSVTLVPSLAPGAQACVTMSSVIDDLPAARWQIKLDPHAMVPELADDPGPPVLLGRGQLSDLAITAVTPSNISPSEGETVFFDVATANLGKSLVRGVSVSGYITRDNLTSLTMETQAEQDLSVVDLKPGEKHVFRVRWDPFRNAGTTNLSFAIRDTRNSPDANPSNNVFPLSLKARTKALIQNVETGILPITPEDASKRQIRVRSRITNKGESPAQGLKIVFYAAPEHTPANLMGEVTVGTIAPGETKEAVLIYPLKPAEEDRPFRISAETVLKGSLQRTPLR